MITHAFDWVQTSVGIFVGLSIARLVTSAVNMHIARKNVAMDWIPFVWAVTIFVLLIQFSWTFAELEPMIEVWTFGLFLNFLAFPLVLFAAAALILPNIESQAGKSLTAFFRENGRWSVLFWAFYALLLYPLNWFVSGLTPIENPNPAALMLITLALTAFFTSSRRILAIVTVLDLLLTLGLLVEGVFGGA